MGFHDRLHLLLGTDLATRDESEGRIKISRWGRCQRRSVTQRGMDA